MCTKCKSAVVALAASVALGLVGLGRGKCRITVSGFEAPLREACGVGRSDRDPWRGAKDLIGTRNA